MELRKGLKVMKRKTVISLIIATILVVSLITAIVFTQSEKAMLLKEAKQELKRAMNYDEFEEGEENVEGTDNVKFSAFFLRDLNADGYAEKIKGTCKPIGSEDTLYMELNVLTAGYLKDAKVEINGKNFYLQTALPKDNELKNNYIGNNVKIIEFNNIVNGTQRLFSGIVRSGDYSYSSGKTAAIGNNIANYSREDNTIIFSGTYVAEDGTETRIVKIIPIIMDWYGSVNATIGSTTQNHYDLDNRIDEENNSLVLDFTVNVSETQNKLILSKNYVEGEIPELNGFAPTYVGLENSQGLTFNYDEETRKFTIERLATLEETLVTKTVARSSSYKFQVVYPYEAYEDNFGDTITLKIPVRTYFEGYNNSNTEFENPYVSNTAKATVIARFEEEIKSQSRIEITVGKFLTIPERRYMISKQKPLNIYNGIVEEEIEDRYEVSWKAYIGSRDNNKILTMMESNEEIEECVSDSFIKIDSSEESMEELVSNVGIYIKDIDKKFLNQGIIKIFDLETNNLLVTFTKDNWDDYNEKNPYYYEFPVKHVKIETSEIEENVVLEVIHIKEINDNKLTTRYTKDEFDELVYIESTVKGYIDNKEIGCKTGIGKYEEVHSVATLSVSKDVFSTQLTEKNVNVSIHSEYNMQNNQIGWKNGTFLLKFPKEIIDLKLNEIKINTSSVNIDTHEVIKDEENIFVKINTTNKVKDEETYIITLNLDISPDPRIATCTGDVELYANNENECTYYFSDKDVYDINGNLNVDELINKSIKKINLVAPSSLLTNQIVCEFDKENTLIISPQIADVSIRNAEVESDIKTAKIGVQIKNNYTNTISEVTILGRIPFEGNSTVLTDWDLESEFTTKIINSGIIVPEELKDYVKIYYSENLYATKDINLDENEWIPKEDVTSFENIKSYLIDLGNYSLDIGKEHVFYYTVEIPENIEVNKVSYSHHGVYFCLDTEEGKYKTETEPNKLGLRLTEKYNLEIIKFQTGKGKVISGATYVLNELVDDQTVVNVKSGVTSVDGKIIISNLYAGKIYEIHETKSPVDYELNSNIVRFTTKLDENLNLVAEKEEGDIREDIIVGKDVNDKNIVTLKVEDEAKARLRVVKKEKDSDNLVGYAKYRVFGKDLPENGKIITTNKDGETILSGFKVNEEYSLVEIKADGYYLKEQIKFKLVNNNGIYSVEIIEGDVYSSSVTEDNYLPIINITIENEKIPTYDLEISKIKRVLETELNNNEEEHDLEENEPIYLSGARFKLYKGQEEIGTYETDENGKFYITDLYEYQEGREDAIYTLKEVVTPEGYTKVKDIIFKVQNIDGTLKFINIEGKEEKYTVEDNTVKLIIEDSPRFKLIKKDYETGDVLKGIKFAFYNADENIPAIDSKGNIIGNKEIINGKEYYVLETDSKGEILVDLPEGLYKAVEVEAPEKYDIKNNEYYFGIGSSKKGSKGLEIEYAIRWKGDSVINDIQETQDGGYIIRGNYSTNLDFGNGITLRNFGSADAMFVKCDGDWNVEWANRMGGDSIDYGDDIIEMPDGSFIAIATLRGRQGYIGDNISINISSSIVGFGGVIAKYSNNGELLWYKVLSGGNNTFMEDLMLVDNNSFIVGGYFNSNSLNVGNGITLTNRYNVNSGRLYSDGMIIKYNSNGRPEFAKSITSNEYGSEQVKSIIKTNDGGFLVSGLYSSSRVDLGNDIVLKNDAITDTNDIMIIKYDSNWNIEWAKGIGGEKDESFGSIIQNKNNEYILTGTFYSPLINVGDNVTFNKASSSVNSADAIIIVFDENGEMKFYKDYSVSNEKCTANLQTIGGMKELNNGGYILNGEGISEQYIIKYSPEIEIDWSQSFSISKYPAVDTVIELNKNEYIIGGSFNGTNLDLGEDVVLGTTETDTYKGALIAKFNVADKIEYIEEKMTLNANIKTVAATDDGGYVAGGSFKETLTLNNDIVLENNTGVIYGLLIKYNSSNEIEWTKKMQSNDEVTVYSVTSISDGGIIVTGLFRSRTLELENGIVLTNNGTNADIMILKYNLNGNLEWAKNIGGSSYDLCMSVNPTTDGGFLIGGYFASSQISLGNGVNITKSGGTDVMMLKFDRDGEFEWVESFGGTGSEYIYDAKETNDGGYIAVGSFSSNIIELKSGHKLEKTSSSSEGFIVKYDRERNIEWAKSAGNRIISLNTVIPIGDKGYIVGGKEQKETQTVDYSGVVKEYNSKGQEVEKYIIGYEIKKINLTNEHEYLIAGSFKSSLNLGIEKTFNSSGYSDAFYLKTDEFGKTVWAGSDGANEYEESVDIIKLKNNDIIAVSKFSNSSVLTKMTENRNVEEKNELIVENKLKGFKISTSVNKINDIAGGTISGETKAYNEIVKYGEDSLVDIVIEPDKNYEIAEINVNGEDFRFDPEEDGSYVMPVFTNVTKDILVEVTFALQTNKITINKVDSETKDGLGKVEFDIQQIEERNELNDEIGNIEDNGEEYLEINLDALENDSKGTLTDNGEVYGGAPDKTIELNDVLGSLTNNGTYYFTNVDGKYIPNNKGINNGIAYSYIKVDLSNYTGNYIVTVNASVSSESNYDIGFARITNSITALGYTDATGRFMYISGNIANNDYNSSVLTGGNIYYLHLGYRKDVSVNSNNDEVVINSVKVHPLLEGVQYNFEEVDGKYVSTNQGLASSVSNSYIPIDLRDKEGTYAVIINALISSQSNGDYGYATITEGAMRPAYNSTTGRFVYISGTTSSRDYQSEWLEGGKLYYLHLGYYKNSTTDVGDDRFTINSVNVYKADGVSYEFVENNGVYVSNNQGMHNTTANSYIPIDMTNLEGEYNIIVNAEISSQIDKDYGFLVLSEDITRPLFTTTIGRFAYISGDIASREYISNNIFGGKVYYLHLGYYKGSSGNAGDDTFKINSVRVVPNEEHLYNTSVTTNSWGKAITQIPYGKYAITEINTPEGYEPLDSSVIIEFRENGEKEFTIENKKFAKVIVHHYKAEVDIARNGYTYTEEKLAEDEVYMDRTGYPYKTSPKLDLGEYSLITDALGEYILPENATGQYNGVIEVNYYYSASKIPLRVQHIIEGTEDRVELATGEKSEDNISFGKLGESYETAPLPKEELHEKYEVIGSTDNASGTYEYSDIVVNYYYKIKEFDVTTGVKMKTQTDILGNESVVAGGTILGANEDVYETVLYGEDSTKDIVATPDEGYYVETLTINDEPVAFTPDENGIVRLANFSNMREDKMVMVGFAQDKGKVTVHHKLQDVDEYVPSIEDGKTVEPEIKEGDIGKPFATKPSDKVALRYEAKSNTEPSSGVYTLEDQEVTYYYGYKDFEYKIEYYYNGVLDETKTENGIATWGTVIDSYTDKVEYGYELGEVENYPLTVSEYVENNIIKVNYEPKDTSLIVKYVDKHTGEEIAERKTVPGKMFEKHDLTEDIIDIEGYTFLEIPEPIIVDTSLEVKEYIIYYAANTKVTINYLDKTDGKVLETIIIEGKVDDPYEAYAKDFDKYVIDTKPENETGLMTREEIVLNYYYIYVSDGVIEKHIDVKEDRLLDSNYYTGMEGDPYTTDKKEFVGYDILTNKQYYKEFIKEQFTEDELLELLKEYNLETEDELFEKYTEDLILKVLKEKGLNADDEYIPENKDGFMEKGVIEVKYYYVRKTKVIVEYIDKQTGKPVQVETKVDLDGDGVIDEVRVADAIEIIEGHEGDKYETIAKEFDGYILQKDEEGNDVIPENAIGEMTKEDIFVRYEYIKKAKVIEKHIDVKTGILIENVIVHEGYVGKEYDIKSKEFDKYHVVEDKLPINSKGTMIDGDIIVEYYYIHEGKVIIEYLDKYSGERLQEKVEKDLNDDLIIDDSEFELVDSTVIIEGLEGDEYTSSAKEFEKYKLVETELPSNGSGTMTKEDITVKYYYVKESVGVREEHRDSSTNELLEESIMHPGYEGDSYKINSKEFNNYDLDSDKLPKNSEGKMSKEEIVVTYYYKRKTEVIVKYVNDETGEELLEEVVIKGHVGDTYTTEEKVIDGYTLVKISSNREGKMDKNVIVVTYYYVKAPDVIHKPEEPEVPKVPNVPEVQEQPKEDADHVVIGNTVTVNNQVVNIVSNTVITANTVTNTTNTTNTIVSNTVKNEDYNKDKEVETPKTGDNTPIVLVIACMVVLLLNTMYVLASTNKKQKPKNIIIVGKDKKKQK